MKQVVNRSMNKHTADSDKHSQCSRLIELTLRGVELSDGSSQSKNNQNAEDHEAYQPGFRQKFQVQIVSIARPPIRQVQQATHEAAKIPEARAEYR